jgi:hypothetical protein
MGRSAVLAEASVVNDIAERDGRKPANSPLGLGKLR